MNEELLRHHLALIETRWPALAATLAEAQLGELQVELCEGLGSTLLVNGIQLTSRHDRVAEAELQAANLPAARTLHLYGTGLGDLQRTLLARTDLETLHVHILNHSLFTLVLALLEQDDWLQDPRVKLTLASDEQEIALPFFALPSELILVEEGASRVRDRLVGEITLPFVNRRFTPEDPTLQARLQGNLTLLAQDGDVTELFGSESGRRALILGSGPTLSDHVAELATLVARPERPLIIAADTACRTLFAHGITPDWVVSIDHQIWGDRLPPADCGLVYFPLVPNSTLQAWQGRRFAAYSPSPLYASVRQQHPKGELFSGGSVIHVATDLAVRMGCNELVLLGVDLAFVGERTHSGWSPGELGSCSQSSKHWVLNGHGQRVATSVNFATYRAQLERYIAAHPDVHFYNATREGADIAGCPYLPEALR